MTSEWMKVMLEEIERKKTEAEQAQIELKRRRDEKTAGPLPKPIGGACDGPRRG
ncbi:MAG: hypothetical protein WA807_03750 [Steroidobacteraceae bacterium]